MHAILSFRRFRSLPVFVCLPVVVSLFVFVCLSAFVSLFVFVSFSTALYYTLLHPTTLYYTLLHKRTVCIIKTNKKQTKASYASNQHQDPSQSYRDFSRIP